MAYRLKPSRFNFTVTRMEKKENLPLAILYPLLDRLGIGNGNDRLRISPLAGDGSQRRFFRLHLPAGRLVVAILPSVDDAPGMAEARSAWFIGRHLHGAGVPVPELLAFDRQSGLILCEDLGGTRLYDLAAGGAGPGGEKLRRYYRQAVRELARMQVRGGRDFDSAWCWDTPRYDRALMLERESGYFLQSLCLDLLQMDVDRDGLQREFNAIADEASAAPAGFFLHRDFQSRNIMIKEDRVRFIDFQGGRPGPLAYDLASLLIDPYVALPQAVRNGLVGEYLQALHTYMEYDPLRFRREYHYLSLQRNLQILGAFAFLGYRRGKTFFRPFVRPALCSLRALLAEPPGHGYPVLSRLVENCLQKAEKI
ncbi:phosphotransferase enzyme family protein [bacterium BMS3Bbin14]|nr:phosphotransferase enzyme family protein [bacterium BMS3Abin13]GBE52466.1 phosphotransferase enzyme family protein [bacterium BMS3Bbin14]HDK44170.1 aminoglycoside phosphotransferase [Desulfobacteraceae bacterium]HDO31512.1 aminoglycoside phosphotransferase [Desulfobacteraceae bacterium]HDZ75962.1 aminoglycoside phosphotransferase [Desulfobacteraceae bacterium]